MAYPLSAAARDRVDPLADHCNAVSSDLRAPQRRHGLRDTSPVHACTQHAATGRTRLDHWERFAGLLLPIARGMVYDATVASFHALNAALAKRATTH